MGSCSATIKGVYLETSVTIVAQFYNSLYRIVSIVLTIAVIYHD